MMSQSGKWNAILEHRLVKRRRKNKVEYVGDFCGYGPLYNMWQDDLSNCKQLVSQYCASKPEFERLFCLLI